MKINEKIRAFFGLPAEATDAEVDQKLNESIDAQEGSDAGATDSTEEADATTTEATEQEMEAPREEAAAAPGITMEQVNAAITAATQPLIERLQAVEGQDAEAHTDGEREAVTVTDEEQPIWMRNPINQAAAKINPKK